MLGATDGEVISVALEDFAESYGRLRLRVADAERAMIRSLERYGQLAPVVAFWEEEELELIDGFKRLLGARLVRTIPRLTTRVIDVDRKTAKAAIYLLNRVGSRTSELEEARIVHSLVREEGLSQLEVAALVGRHKSWVSRRVALIEKLCAEAKQDLWLGFLTPTAARALVRLPLGNQPAVVETARREALTTPEVHGLVDRWLESGSEEARRDLLKDPRARLEKGGRAAPATDPRLSRAGQRLQRKLHLALELLEELDTGLRYRARHELGTEDAFVLTPGLESLQKRCLAVAEVTEDFLGGTRG